MNLKMTSERGQALILIALAMVGMVAIVGLAIDGSRKFADQRHAQNAADTAAIAAALAKVDALKNNQNNTPPECPPSGGSFSPVCIALQNAGGALAQNNGYTNNLTTSTVEIYSPPISGHYVGDYDYVQVIITSFINTTFMKVIGITQTQNTVQAVALAKPEYNLAQGAMIISYDPDPNCSVGGTGGYSVQVNGNATINLTGGGFFLNSDETCGFKIPNCADLNIYSGSINSVGNNIDTGSCTFDPPVTKNINQNPVVIPDEVYWPPVPPECSPSTPGTAYQTGPDEYHITPGFYTNFPQQSINGDLFGIKKNIIMDPGVYCTNKDIKWSGNTFKSLDGSSGVTLYLLSGYDFSLNIDAPITLNAPTSGDYQGYLIIQEGTYTDIHSCIINGGAYLNINGLIFAPYCDITVNGTAGETAVINAQLVGWDIKINGNNAINFNYDPSNQVKIKRKVGLMK